MNPQKLFFSLVLASLLFTGCQQDTLAPDKSTSSVQAMDRLDVGLEALLGDTEITAIVTPRMGGYTASARGKGTIPSGEYAGHRFQIDLDAHYSGEGNGTLESGSALVKIRGERFVSTMDALLQSFCCGEGDLIMFEGEWIFTMFGQVVHTTGAEPHNHLFAGLASTAGTMNMNIADQSGTVVIQADPPHDPGIGLIEGFSAQRVEVVPD